jgi:hypothetical protein
MSEILDAMKQPEVVSVDYRISANPAEFDRIIYLLTIAAGPSTSSEFLHLITSVSTRSILAERLAYEFAYGGN